MVNGIDGADGNQVLSASHLRRGQWRWIERGERQAAGFASETHPDYHQRRLFDAIVA